MKRILITWGAGFIGSNFLNKYVKLYPEYFFINVDALTYAWKLSNLDVEILSSENYAFEKVDIRNNMDLERVFLTYQPTDIIHFAAESHVDNSIKNPKIFVETNVLWTQNLLDLYRKYHLKRFYQVSTDEVYWDIPESGFFLETTPINPSSPYSASKAAADLLVKAYGRTFGIDYVISRCSNNYGRNQDKEKLIPHFISLLKQNHPVTVYGDGSNIRDRLFVEDHCDAIWKIFNHAKAGSIYNIGGNNEYTNLEITKILLDLFWKDESYISFVADRPWHDKRYAIDASKLKNELGWVPKVKFDEGIRKTIDFYL